MACDAFERTDWGRAGARDVVGPCRRLVGWRADALGLRDEPDMARLVRWRSVQGGEEGESAEEEVTRGRRCESRRRVGG